MEHVNITDPNIHEVKGASTAAAGDVLTANGDGTTSFATPTVYSNVEVGFYRLVNSSASPVALTVASTYYTLTNDGVGSGSSSTYGVDGITDVWDETNNRFTFSALKLGDTVVVHIDVNVTTTGANTAVDIDVELAVGGTTYTIPMITGANIKTASTVRFTAQRHIFLRDTNTKDFPARIKAKADATGATVLVNEFDLGVYKRG